MTGFPEEAVLVTGPARGLDRCRPYRVSPGICRSNGERDKLTEERMIRAQAMTARVACARMTVVRLTALHDSVERACRFAARSQWDRKAAAHAEIFSLLADVAADQRLAGSAASAHQLILAVGRAADGMIISSRRRLLSHLHAGDSEKAELEMEKHLRALFYMRRLARPGTGLRMEQ